MTHDVQPSQSETERPTALKTPQCDQAKINKEKEG